MTSVQVEKGKTMNKPKDNPLHFETFRLTLSHFYSDENGKHFDVEEPLVVQFANVIGEYGSRIEVNMIIKRLLYEMENAYLMRMNEEGEG